MYPDVKLIPETPYEKATCHMLIDGFQRVAGYLFKALKFKDTEAFNEIYKILDSYEKYLTEDFFSGKKTPGKLPPMRLKIKKDLIKNDFI